MKPSSDDIDKSIQEIQSRTYSDDSDGTPTMNQNSSVNELLAATMEPPPLDPTQTFEGYEQHRIPALTRDVRLGERSMPYGLSGMITPNTKQGSGRNMRSFGSGRIRLRCGDNWTDNYAAVTEGWIRGPELRSTVEVRCERYGRFVGQDETFV